MKALLREFIDSSHSLSIGQILLRLGVAIIIGLVIFISYRISNAGTLYSRKFNFTLFMLTILTTAVMTVIGNNLALSLGMVGALSIVRFRTAIKDSRDTAYIFWTIIAGICCGAGDFEIAGIFTGAVFLVTLIFGNIRNDDRFLLVVRAERTASARVEALVFKYLGTKAKLRVKNSTETAVEIIYEFTSAQLEKSERNKLPIVDAMYELTGIEYVNLIAQNDDIRS